MSVRVNLLPEATKQRDRATQQRALAAMIGVVLLAGLGGVYWWAASQVSQAEIELAAEEARTAELRGEQAELVAFRELANRRDRSDGILIAALNDEVSLAGVLQDIAAVMPVDAQLESLSVTIAASSEIGLPVVGNINMTGKTLTSHAPGVERMLLSLDKIVSFRDTYLNSSTLDDTDDRIATFSLDGQIGPEAETGRYTSGLPEVLR